MKFDAERQRIKQEIINRKLNARQARIEGTTIYIPIVFHIVLQNQSQVTDAQIQAQVDQLNMDYGLNGDSTKIPSFLKPLYAKSNIQFRLAQRNPNNESSTGIERITTTRTSFDLNDARVKYTASGGADAWDNSRFFNVWICNLQQPYLGYATFPNGGSAAEDGVVIKYTRCPVVSFLIIKAVRWCMRQGTFLTCYISGVMMLVVTAPMKLMIHPTRVILPRAAHRILTGTITVP